MNINQAMKTCCIACLIYFVLVLIFTSNISCSTFENIITPTNVNRTIDCVKVVKKCIEDIKEAKQTEDPVAILIATGECNEQIIYSGCIELEKEIQKNGQNSGNN